jgi:hypothetical protein
LNPKFGIWDGNIRIRDNHPGSATLILLDPDPLNARVYLVPIVSKAQIHVTLIEKEITRINIQSPYL